MVQRTKLREHWLHKPTGRLWAIELDDGAVIGACGPLELAAAADVPLDYLTYWTNDVDWIIANRTDFVRSAISSGP